MVPELPLQIPSFSLAHGRKAAGKLVGTAIPYSHASHPLFPSSSLVLLRRVFWSVWGASMRELAVWGSEAVGTSVSLGDHSCRKVFGGDAACGLKRLGGLL